MSSHDPNELSPQFAAASAGYLSVPAAELPLIRAALPRPYSRREEAIVAAIEHGIKHPLEWDARRRERLTIFHHPV